MSTRTKRAKKHAEMQTDNLDYMLQIARLQEQVTLLTIENDHLRKHITENQPLKPATPRTPDVANAPGTGASKRRTTQLKNKAAKNGKVTGRGCNCKGNCANRTCGCVKKDTQCGEFCRCNNTLCQNQEERGTEGNKENEESNERVEPEKITNKQLANVTAHKSIFSPDGTLHSTPSLESSRPSSIYFGSPKKLTFEPDEEEKEEEKKVQRKAVKILNADGVNRLDRDKRVKRPRVRGNNLEVNPDQTRKLRSSSNEEKGNSMGGEKQTLRRCISSELSVQSPEELEEINKQTDNHLQNIAAGIAPLRRRQKMGKGSVIERRKNIPDSDTPETSPDPVEDNATEASQDAAVQVSTSLDQDQMGSPLSNDLHGSESSDVIQDSDFNPMKPQHELTRTPAHNSDSSSGNTSSGVLSDILPLTPVFTIKMEEPPIPPELSQPEVNWDEHQSQLVACKKCKRKFHSFRITKHQACCKKL